jgi:hypothetical protein
LCSNTEKDFLDHYCADLFEKNPAVAADDWKNFKIFEPPPSRTKTFAAAAAAAAEKGISLHLYMQLRRLSEDAGSITVLIK